MTISLKHSKVKHLFSLGVDKTIQDCIQSLVDNFSVYGLKSPVFLKSIIFNVNKELLDVLLKFTIIPGLCLKRVLLFCRDLGENKKMALAKEEFSQVLSATYSLFLGQLTYTVYSNI